MSKTQNFLNLKKLLLRYEVWGDKPHNYRCLAGGKETGTTGKYQIPAEKEKDLLTFKFLSKALGRGAVLSPVWNEIHPLVLDCDNEELIFDEIFPKILAIIKDFFPKAKYDHFIEKSKAFVKYHVIFPEIFVNQATTRTLNERINEQLGKDTVDEAIERQAIRFPNTWKPQRNENREIIGFKKNTNYVPVGRKKLTLQEFLTIRNLRRDGVLTPVNENIEIQAVKEIKTKQLEAYPAKTDMSAIKWVHENYQILKTKITENKIVWEINKKCPKKQDFHKSNATLLVYLLDKGTIGETCRDKQDCGCHFKKVYPCLPAYAFYDTDDEDESSDDTIDLQLTEAKDFLKHHKGDIRKINNSQWYIFNKRKKIWEINEKAQLTKKVCEFLSKRYKANKSICEKTLKRLGSAYYGGEVVKILKGYENDREFPTKLNQKRNLLSVKNGVIDLKTGELRDRKREDMLDYILDINYIPQEIPEDSVLKKFLYSLFSNKAYPETYIKYVQTLLGYCITGEISEQIFLILIGDGSNGKGVLLGLLHGVLKSLITDLSADNFTVGKMNSANDAKTFHKLAGKRIGVLDETQKNCQLNMAMVKKMTGLSEKEKVECKALYKDCYDSLMHFKLMMATNHCPKINTTEHSEVRRLAFVHFDRTFVDEHRLLDEKKYPPHLFGKKDKKLAGKIDEEGLFFNWLVQGAKQYYNNGIKTPKEEVRKMNSTLNKSDPVKMWLTNQNTETNVWTSVDDCYVHFVEESEEEMSSQTFKKNLKLLGFKKKRKIVDREYGKQRCYCYNIELTKNEAEAGEE